MESYYFLFNSNNHGIMTLELTKTIILSDKITFSLIVKKGDKKAKFQAYIKFIEGVYQICIDLSDGTTKVYKEFSKLTELRRFLISIYPY